MKGWIMLVVALVLVSGFSTLVYGENLKAGESVTTDKPVYVRGEIVTLFITGDPNTTYDLTINWDYLGEVETDENGSAMFQFSTNRDSVNIGMNNVQLRDLWSWDILASTNFEVREGLTLWPSKYTDSNTYLNGETIWIKLHGEDNKEYRLNITNSTGVKVYPSHSPYFTITTNDTGVAIFNITAKWGDDGYDLNLFNEDTYIQSAWFRLASIGISITLDKANGVYLLSDRLNSYVSIYWLRTQELLNNVTYRWWIVDADNPSITFGPYASSTSELVTEPLDFYTTSEGDVIHPHRKYYLRVEYEMRDGDGEHHAEAEVTFYTGDLAANIHSYSRLSPGNDAKFQIHAFAHSLYYSSHGDSVIEGASVEYVNITIEDHWKIIWTHNYTNLGKTNANGNYEFVWNVPQVPYGADVYLKVGIRKGDDNATAYYHSTIHSGNYVYAKFINSRKSYGENGLYLSGDTVNIELGYQSNSNDLNISWYEVSIWSEPSEWWSYNNLLYHTTTNGNIVSYTLPDDYQGWIYVGITGHFSDGTTDYYHLEASVKYGILYLDISPNYYISAGDEITIYSVLDSNVIDTTTVNYTICDEYGNKVLTVRAPLGNYTFTVPGNSDFYTIKGEIKYGNIHTYGETRVFKYKGYVLETKLVTPSDYQNNIYKPGQTIEIRYNITKYGDFDPGMITLHWAIEGTDYQWEKVITEGELSGVIKITIPQELSGIQIIQVWVTWSTEWSIWITGIEPKTYNTIPVEIQSGSWAMKSIAGMPMSSFVNMVLGIVALVIAVIALILLKKGGTGERIITKKGAPKPYSPDGEEEMGEEPEELSEEEYIEEEDEELEI